MALSMSRAPAFVATTVALCSIIVCSAVPSLGQASDVARVVGTVTKIEGDSITIASDSDGDVRANLTSSARILRVAPGEKDLKNATSITRHDLQPGDRVLVRGQSGPDGHTINALAVIVMKQTDVNEKRRREKEDWQKRGVGGLVSEVDASQGTITVSLGGLGRSRNIVVHTTKNTILRRYAPSSTKFDDAKPAPLEQIKPGDQLLARGESSSDGSSLSAEEVVSGTFRNIAGTVAAVDAANQTVTVRDLIQKGEVQIKVSPDSQIKKIPAEMARRIAMRLKSEGDSDGAGKSQPGSSLPIAASREGTSTSRIQGEGRNGHAGGDLQRLLTRLPSSSVGDLHQGDVVMVVSTTGETSGPVTAITVLAGVEPILAAAPSRSASAALSAWTLGGPSMEGAEP